ncbi:hypothetical protein EV421DRAFT_1810832 [Armillaria borealis]|uniref:Uncharacterized protein n=1 Tax=Armillaria borealis TaxID=47425 RepID=A0AA39JFZ9_9AGAR|nr:hypothetical protein EV421DRAFT_1810832 [Armillaria borealis]
MDMNHPPCNCYFAFSIDVAATLDLYCDGGDDAILQKLNGLKDRVFAGYCVAVERRSNEDNKFHTAYIRPVQQGLTKLYRDRRNLLTHGRPCAFRSYLKRSIPGRGKLCSCRNHYLGATTITLPLPTCYDVRARVLTERRDYSQLPRVMGFSPQIVKPLAEDARYYRLLQSGLRILDGQEDAPDTGNTSETDSQSCHMFFANIPGSEVPEEDRIFMPVLRIDHVLSNVPEISDPSQLWEDRDLFAE